MSTLILRWPTMTHFRVRALEWQVTGMTLVAACLLLVPGYETMSTSVFEQMREWGGDNFWACVFGSIGLLRAFALWRNGGWVPSPWIRAITAAISAALWGIVCMNLLTEMKAYLILAPFITALFSDVYSAGRASTDARLSYDERLKQPEAPRVLAVSQ